MGFQLNKCFFLMIWAFVINLTVNVCGDSRFARKSKIDVQFPPYEKLLSGSELMTLLLPNRPLFLVEHDPSAAKPLFVFSGANRNFSVFRHRNTADIHRSESSFADGGEVLVLSSDDSIIKRVPATKLQDGINFVGAIFDDPSSYVHGHLTQNRFEGVIRTNNRMYFVERAGGDSNGMSNVYQISNLGVMLSRLTNRSEIDVDYRGEVIQQDYIAKRHKNVDDHRTKPIRQSWMYPTDQDVWPKDCSVRVVVDFPFFQHVGGLDVNRTISEVEIHFREINLFLERNDFDFDGRLNDLRLTISKIEIVSQPPSSTSTVSLKTELSAVEYLSSITKSSFADCCFVVLFTFMRFTGDESSQLFVNMPRCRRSLVPLFRDVVNHRELCGKDVWVVSFNGHGDFKIPRAMSIIRMVSHVGHLLGIAEPGPESSNYLPYSGNDWLMNVKYSDCAKRVIAQSLALEELCSPRYNVGNSKRELRMARNRGNENDESVDESSDDRFRPNQTYPIGPEDEEEPQDKENRNLRQVISEWWKIPHAWTQLGEAGDDFVAQPLTCSGSSHNNLSSVYVISILLWLWLPFILTFE